MISQTFRTAFVYHHARYVRLLKGMRPSGRAPNSELNHVVKTTIALYDKNQMMGESTRRSPNPNTVVLVEDSAGKGDKQPAAGMENSLFRTRCAISCSTYCT